MSYQEPTLVDDASYSCMATLSESTRKKRAENKLYTCEDATMCKGVHVCAMASPSSASVVYHFTSLPGARGAMYSCDVVFKVHDGMADGMSA